MKIKHTRIENFYSIGVIEIDFSRYYGKVLAVLGANRDSDSQDSNGSGKSSVIEAIVWSLFGKLLRPSLVQDVVRKGSPVCSVETTLGSGDKEHTIKRSRINNKLRGWIDGKECTSDELTVWVEDRFKISFDEFIASCVFCQTGSITPFSRMTDKDKKSTIERMRNLTKLVTAQKCASSIARDSESRKEHHKKSIVDLERVVEELKASSETSIDDLKKQLEDANRKLADLKPMVTSVHDELAEAQETLAEASTAKSKWSTDITNQISESSDLLNESQTDVSKVSELQSGALSKKHLIGIELNEAQVLVDKGMCPTCGSDVTHGKIGKNLLAKIREKKAELESAEAEYNKHSLAVNVASKVLSTRKSELQKLRSAKVPEDIVSRYNEAETSVATLHDRLSVIETDKSAVEAEIRVLRQQIRSSNTTRRGELDELEKTIYEHAIKSEMLEECTVNSSAVKKALSPAGVRSWLMDSACMKIGDYATTILQSVTDDSAFIRIVAGKKADGTPTERLAVQSRLSELVEPMTSQSPGELRLADICIQLGLHKYLCSDIISTDGFGLMIFDDVLDVLDSTAARAVIEAICHYASESGECVLVASPDMLPTSGASIVTVVKQNGVSSVEKMEA